MSLFPARPRFSGGLLHTDSASLRYVPLPPLTVGMCQASHSDVPYVLGTYIKLSQWSPETTSFWAESEPESTRASAPTRGWAGLTAQPSCASSDDDCQLPQPRQQEMDIAKEELKVPPTCHPISKQGLHYLICF